MITIKYSGYYMIMIMIIHQPLQCSFDDFTKLYLVLGLESYMYVVTGICSSSAGHGRLWASCKQLFNLFCCKYTFPVAPVIYSCIFSFYS